MNDLIKKIVGKGAGWIASPIESRKLAQIVFAFINKFTVGRPPKESLIFLLELERHLSTLTGAESCRYGQGVHTKHKHTHYHDFFTKRICFGEKVLDIGCGNGALSFDMAKAGAQVIGMDINSDHIAFALNHYSHPGMKLIQGDVLKDLPENDYDTIIISNVLEHIEDRIGFLRKVQERFMPERWLIRVPLYERDWRVPLMEEIGVDYRQDDTHYIEYTRESFIEELKQAGLIPVFMDIRWGEIWCEAGPEKEDVR